ncbi:PQQ-dependent sugar dehydrogenase [Psychroserpens sp. XS_ASV72]|uniref:PQQ-dependent sugar dehydrogenase n=1 Tax=Psychroserpens sp. XS_ASV72 TaxID=3241293 RepID=UPI003516A069
MKKITQYLLYFLTFIGFAQDIDLELFASGFTRPVNVKHAGDDRLFVAEQRGMIKILNANGATNPTPFLDIRSIVNDSGNEQGLLGLAFHPDYTNNGYFYVNYINSASDTVVSRFTRSTDDIADPNSEVILLTIDQPFSNHNGGDMHFGPNDGYLYISSGDGGSGGDPGNRAQNTTLLLGKILRIDVDGNSNGNYGIPADNPYVSDSNVLDEIWAYGLRNPWKFSFDRDNGDLWIADVGQSNKEEINRVPASDGGGENYGWRCYEGNSTYNTSGCPAMNTLTFPVAEYNYGGSPFRCSISGGYRYRGTQQSTLQGLYFFADFCSDEIGIVREISPGNFQLTFETQFNGEGISGFAENLNGELYTIGLSSGEISRIVDSNLSVDEETLNPVKIFPNPANDVLNIDGNGTSIQIESIRFYDVLGKEVKTVSGFEEQSFSINIKDLRSGVYIVVINSINGNKSTRKLVVN